MPTDTTIITTRPPDHEGRQNGKDPITCHVLDLTTGLPAVSMSVKLKALTPSNLPAAQNNNNNNLNLNLNRPSPHEPSFNARTNADGRIMRWGAEEGISVEELMLLYSSVQQRTVWVLTFDTEAYFGEGKGFFPAVEVRFYMSTEKGSHVHVPLLIGPYSYTTYRGS